MKTKNVILLLTVAVMFSGGANAAVSTMGNVDPDPSTWTLKTDPYIGKTDDGFMEINGGSALTCDVAAIGGYLSSYSGVTGEVTVTGGGSTWINYWLIVGNYGTGNLNISNGGKVTCNNGADIGANYTGIGTVTVTGAGSQWITDTHGYDWLYIGDYGTGSLNISDGGHVSSAISVIGNYSGSGSATVTGSGSKWINSGDLVIGFSDGYGTLTIENGGLVIVDGSLWTDGPDPDYDNDSYVHIATGGMLALYNSDWIAGDDIEDFLKIVQGTDEICYYNGSAWDNIINATAGIDYTLEHIIDGSLAGYTVLTVEICVVNLEDFAMFAAYWLDTPCNEANNWCEGADLDQMGDVDIVDLTQLASEWLNICPTDWPLN